MATDVKTSSDRPRFFNKYVEYRRQYESACEKFSSKLDEAKSADKPKPDPSPAKSDLGDKDTAETPAKHLAKHSVKSSPGVSSRSDVSETADVSPVPTSPSTSEVPNIGVASDRMLDKVKEYEPFIRAAAARYGLDPNWIAGVIWQESRGNFRAVSHCGAMGLMQLMPETAKNLGVENAFDPGQNIDGGAKYLRQMLDKFGRMDHATAAYNAGPGNVQKFGGVPPFRETQDYVPHVLGFANSFKVANAFQEIVSSSAVRV